MEVWKLFSVVEQHVVELARTLRAARQYTDTGMFSKLWKNFRNCLKNQLKISKKAISKSCAEIALNDSLGSRRLYNMPRKLVILTFKKFEGRQESKPINNSSPNSVRLFFTFMYSETPNIHPPKNHYFWLKRVYILIKPKIQV